jgi:hypothetical protein
VALDQQARQVRQVSKDHKEYPVSLDLKDQRVIKEIPVQLGLRVQQVQ